MGEKVLKVKTVSDVAEAISGLTDLTGSLKNVGTAAIEAAGKSKAEWKALEGEWQKTSPTLKGIADAAFSVESALNKMGRASSEFRLEAGLVKAQVALTQYKAKLEEVRAAGGTIDEGMRSSLAVMESGVQAGTEKLRAMRDATAQAKEALGLIGTAGEQAGRKIEAGAKDAWTELEKLGTEGKDAATALRALETAEGPRALAKNAGLAAFHVEDLTNKLKAAGPAGEASLGRISGVMKSAEAAIGSAADKAGRMKDAMGDLGERSKMAGDKLQTLGGSVGSLDGMFQRMRDTGTGATKVIGDIGVGAGVAVAGIMGAVAAGKQAAQWIDEWDAGRAKKDKAAADATVQANLLDQANRAVTRGLIEQGKTTDETVERYIRMTLQMGRLTEQGRKYIESTAGMKAPLAWEEVEKKAQAMAATLTGAYKRSEEEGHRWALENAKEIKAVIASYDEVGKTVPEALTKAIAEAEKWAGANVKAAAAARALGDAASGAVAGVAALKVALEGIGKGDTAKSIEAVAEALAKIRAGGGDVGEAVGQNTEKLRELRKVAEGSYETLDAFRKKVMDQIPAYAATALSAGEYQKTVEDINSAYEKFDQDRREQNKRDLETSSAMAKMREEAIQVAYAIDTIGEAFQKATGKAAGFTVEVRHATKTVVEADPEYTAFIESLASVSDEFMGMTPWVGALIKRLEDGDLSVAEFHAEIDNLRVAFMQIDGVSGRMFGPIEQLFTRLTKLVNDFTYGERGKKK